MPYTDVLYDKQLRRINFFACCTKFRDCYLIVHLSAAHALKSAFCDGCEWMAPSARCSPFTALSMLYRMLTSHTCARLLYLSLLRLNIQDKSWLLAAAMTDTSLFLRPLFRHGCRRFSTAQFNVARLAIGRTLLVVDLSCEGVSSVRCVVSSVRFVAANNRSLPLRSKRRKRQRRMTKPSRTRPPRKTEINWKISILSAGTSFVARR